MKFFLSAALFVLSSAEAMMSRLPLEVLARNLSTTECRYYSSTLGQFEFRLDKNFILPGDEWELQSFFYEVFDKKWVPGPTFSLSHQANNYEFDLLSSERGQFNFQKLQLKVTIYNYTQKIDELHIETSLPRQISCNEKDPFEKLELVLIP